MTDASSSLQPHELFVEAEISAERTVSLLRIFVALALGSVFVFAVLPDAPRDDPELLLQWVYAVATMAAYLTLGIVSFAINVRGLYRPWMAWPVVTGDVVFIIISAWLGLSNLGVAANYLGAMPAVWLLPMVLAFGALRYNPLLQGYVVTLLTLGLIVIAIAEGGWTGLPEVSAPARVNLLFAVPPNIMRLTMIVLAGVVLVIGAFRARALLTRAIEETRRGANLTRYLPQQIASRLAEGGLAEMRRGRRQSVAVLFVDIREFTTRSEGLSPEAISAFISEFRRRIAVAVDACGGVIDKFVGDSAMVVFGLTDDGENHANAALNCTGLILAEIDEWQRSGIIEGDDPVRVGIGVHWGDAFCGAVGDDARLEYTVLGDTVNVAARLEQLTKELNWSVLTSQDTLEAAGANQDLGHWHELESIPLRGRTGLTTIFGSGDVTPASVG